VAPATSAATPVVRSTERLSPAAATPTSRLAVDSRPSLAPSTAARSQPTRWEACRSRWTRGTRVWATRGIVRPAVASPVVPTRYDVTRAELSDRLDGEPSYRVEQVWRGLYGELARLEDLPALPLGLRSRLATELPPALELVTQRVSDEGDTVKPLWALDGGARVETVLMHYPDRTTVCVSSQAGCAMACGLFAAGQAGFERHLSTGEIVEQVVEAARRARRSGRRLSNVV